MNRNSEKSVYELITDLCVNLNPNCDVKELRKNVFEVLLKKNPREIVDIDPHKQLLYHDFEMRFKANGNEDEKKCDEFTEFVEEIERNRFFTVTPERESILTFLTSIRNSANLFERQSCSRTEKSIFQMDFAFDHKNNPFVSTFGGDESFFKLNIPDNVETTCKSSRTQTSEEESPNFFKLEEGVIGVDGRQDFYAKFSKKQRREITNHPEHTECVSNTNEKIINKVDGLNWESLGYRAKPVEKPFVSEMPPSMLHLHSSHKIQEHPIRLVPMANFLRDLKSVTIGVESEIFPWSEEHSSFYLVPGITIENVLPETIATLVDDLLESGTCYSRLQKLIAKNVFTCQHIFDGFVFRSLCSSLQQFLLLFRRFVMSFHDETLLSFKLRVSQLTDQVISLANLCGIHPLSPMNFVLPLGSDFIGHLYKQLVEVTRPDISMLYISILQQCCQDYFKRLQNWIFGGHLVDESKELFVYHVDNYRPNTKVFFDKAYLIRKQSVPEFLKGYEDDILLCGKYTMLLKSFRPSHPLFTVEPLELRVCLTHDKIKSLEHACQLYIGRVVEVCGPYASVEKLFEQRREVKMKFKLAVEMKYKTNLERWRLEQDMKATEINLEKQKRLAELKQQMEEHREQKLAEKIANIELEKYYIQLGIENEEKQIAKDNEVIQKRIAYYEELNVLIEERKTRAEDEVKRLKALELVPADDVMMMSQSSDHLKTPDDSIFKSLRVEIPKSDGDEETTQRIEVILEDSPTPVMTRSSLTDLQNANVTESFNRNKQKILGSTYQMDLNEDAIINDNEDRAIRLAAADTNRARVLREEFNNYRDCDNAAIVMTTAAGDDKTKPIDRNLNELTAAQKNKIKVLGHEFGIDVRKAVHPRAQPTELSRNRDRNEKHFEHDDDEDVVVVGPPASRTPSDRELNKLMAMRSEINQPTDETLPSSKPPSRSPSDRELNKIRAMTSDINREESVTIAVDPHNSSSAPIVISDRQKNRIKVMNQEFDLFREFNAPEIKQQLNLDLDRVKNKRRVLESEYNIITGMTPTSTCSEPSPFVLESSSTTKTVRDFHEMKKFGVPDTAMLNEPTPESAMISNTTGFRFPTITPIGRNDIIPELSINVDGDGDNVDGDTVNNPYALKMNRNGRKFFGLAGDETTDDSKKHCVVNENDMKNMSTTTLTKFLQLSVIIPLNTHFEIINSEILKIFLDDLHILDHFSTLRNYFLLMDGEFGSKVCEGLISRLQSGMSPDAMLNFHMLHMLIETALRSSVLGDDKNAERVSFDVDEIPVKFDLLSPNALANLTLSYQVEWPLNLILNVETLDQYANIFRYLVKVRRISWVVDETFQILRSAVKEHGQAILYSKQYIYVQKIRHNVAHFMMTLQNHITSNALQAAWKIFKSDLTTVNTMEELYRKHTNYIKRILFLCMLNKKSSEFHNTIEDIFKVILRFCYRLKSRSWRKRNDDLYFTHSKFDRMQQDEKDFEKLIKYTIYLGNKIVKHGYQEEIGNLINLININGYYDKK